MNVLGTKPKASLSICFNEKCPNFSIEAVFKQVDVKTVTVQVDLFKLVDVDVDTIVFHERG